VGKAVADSAERQKGTPRNTIPLPRLASLGVSLPFTPEKGELCSSFLAFLNRQKAGSCFLTLLQHASERSQAHRTGTNLIEDTVRRKRRPSSGAIEGGRKTPEER
jgi:hypothetical protein